jgi:hypothetical protein
MFEREAKVMMLLLVAPIVIAFLAALIGPRIVRHFEARDVPAQSTPDAP